MMKKSIYTFLALAALSAGLVSCRKTEAEILTPSNQLDYRLPSEQFLSIWNSMNTSYAMWDLEDVDWTSVKNEYMPEFLALDDSVKADYTISTSHLQELYNGILGGLTDHHAYFSIKNLWASDGDKLNVSVSPGNIEISSRDYYHEEHIHSRYISWALDYPSYGDRIGIHSWDDLTMVAWLKKLQAQGRATDVKYGSVEDVVTVVSGLVDGCIPYIHISDFSLTRLLELAQDDYATQDVEDTFGAYESFKKNVLELDEIKGVIIDLRENGGGYLNDEFYLLGLLIDEPVQMGWSREKSGLGRFDYSPWMPHTFYPGPEHRAVNGPVVVVSDLYSVSMSEITTMLVKAMPNGCFIGERTFGGHGVISGDFEADYAGTFGESGNNHYGYLSSRTVKDYNGDILEGIGVFPDTEMSYAEGTFKGGEDSWLTRAVEYIHNGI